MYTYLFWSVHCRISYSYIVVLVTFFIFTHRGSHHRFQSDSFPLLKWILWYFTLMIQIPHQIVLVVFGAMEKILLLLRRILQWNISSSLKSLCSSKLVICLIYPQLGDPVLLDAMKTWAEGHGRVVERPVPIVEDICFHRNLIGNLTQLTVSTLFTISILLVWLYVVNKQMYDTFVTIL